MALVKRDDASLISKHFATRYPFVRDIFEDERRGIKLDFVATADNQADLFAKGLGKTKAQQFLEQLSAKRGCQYAIWLLLKIKAS